MEDSNNVPTNSSHEGRQSVVTQSEIFSADCDFSANFVQKVFNMYSTFIDNTNVLVIPKCDGMAQSNFNRLIDKRILLSFKKFFNIIQPSYGTLFEFSNILHCIYLENSNNIYYCLCTHNNILSIPQYIVHFNNNEQYVNMFVNFINTFNGNITINGSSCYIYEKFIKIIRNEEEDLSDSNFNKLIKPLLKSSFRYRVLKNRRVWDIIFDNCLMPFCLGPEHNINTMLLSAFYASKHIQRKYVVYFLSIKTSGLYNNRKHDIKTIIDTFNEFKDDYNFCIFKIYKNLNRIGRHNFTYKYCCMLYIPESDQYDVLIDFKDYFHLYKIDIRFAGGIYLTKNISTPEILITKIRMKSYLAKENL
jgi:hypothetical protein